MDDSLRRIGDMAARGGLVVRGAFHTEDGDQADGLAVPGTVVVLGNGNDGAMWRRFASQADPEAETAPLDTWTRRTVDAMAVALGAVARYPFGGPPFAPFLRWARRAEDVHASPLGMLIHPDWGLWHAYRGALVFDRRIALPARRPRPSPCEGCTGRPCLSACPADAFGAAHGYDVAACRAHLADAAGVPCMDAGCLARHACPVAAPYPRAQARHHMRHFAPPARR